MMEVFRILDELELMLKESKKVPFSNGKGLIETFSFLERLDRIRAILPEELETARRVIAEKDRIIQEACASAEEYMEQSKDKVARMVNDSEITKNAMEMAEEIVAKAEKVALEIRKDANEYADEVLSHIEIILKKGLDVVQEGKYEIREALDKNDV